MEDEFLNMLNDVSCASIKSFETNIVPNSK